MENNYWYVGQKVSDQRHGDGLIVNITVCNIVVDFNNRQCFYTIEGKDFLSDKYSCLSQNPHIPLEYKKIFKKGDVVWYCSSERFWCLGIYDCFEEGCHKVNTEFTKANKVECFEYLTDEQIKKFIELKV